VQQRISGGNDRKNGKGKDGRKQVPRCARNDSFLGKLSKKGKGKGKGKAKADAKARARARERLEEGAEELFEEVGGYGAAVAGGGADVVDGVGFGREGGAGLAEGGGEVGGG
jgi:hypothetical protein